MGPFAGIGKLLILLGIILIVLGGILVFLPKFRGWGNCPVIYSLKAKNSVSIFL